MGGLSLLIGQEIWHFKELSRAMSLAKVLVEHYPRTAHGRVIICESLSSAKGRFGRIWYADKGGLWLAVTLYDELLPEHSGLLSLLFGLAMVRTAQDLGALDVRLKWISDTHYRGRKLGGVLLERWQDWFIIGLGLNVNNSLPKGLPAVALAELLGKEVSLRDVLMLLLKWTNHYYEALLTYERALLNEDEDTSHPVVEDFYRFSDTVGRCVAFAFDLDRDEAIFGKALGITSKGALLLKSEEGTIELNSGEIIYL